MLNHDFGDAIRRDRVEISCLIDRSISLRAIVAAGRRKNEAFHAGLFGQLGQPDRGLMVDFLRKARVEITKRVIGETG